MAAATRSERRRFHGLRDWRQTFDPGAEFVWRRRYRYGDALVEPGDAVDKAALGPKRLRTFWHAGAIEIAGWRPTTARARAESVECVSSDSRRSQGNDRNTVVQEGEGLAQGGLLADPVG